LLGGAHPLRLLLLRKGPIKLGVMKLPRLPLAVLVAVMLPACQSEDSPREVFLKMDGDADGRISLVEAHRYMLPRSFAVFDRNGDGYVLLAEARETEPNFDAGALSSRDRNRDGKVSYEEYRVQAEKKGPVKVLFVKIDTNRDGFIGPAEAEAFQKTRQGD
jgi:Ca2+-binding EF-hand superfamily protein